MIDDGEVLCIGGPLNWSMVDYDREALLAFDYQLHTMSNGEVIAVSNLLIESAFKARGLFA